jgi:hypothetical protein
MLEYVIGGVVIAFLVVLVVGAVTGRVKSRSCCSIPDPRQDLRMRAAFEDDPSPPATRA